MFLSENEGNSNSRYSVEKPAKPSCILLGTPDVRNLAAPIPVGRKIIKVIKAPSNRTLAQNAGPTTSNVKTPLSTPLIFNTHVDDSKKTSLWNTTHGATTSMSSTSLATLNGRYSGVVSNADDDLPTFSNSVFECNQLNGFPTQDVPPVSNASTYQTLPSSNSPLKCPPMSPLFNRDSAVGQCGSDVGLLSLSEVGVEASSSSSTTLRNEDYRAVSMMDVLPTNEVPSSTGKLNL